MKCDFQTGIQRAHRINNYSMSGNFMGKERTYYILLGLTLLLAVTIRILYLGKFGFWNDELYHVLAAKAYISDGRLIIPIQGEYHKAIPFTYMVIAFFKLFGVNEIAARMPSVILNLLFIITGFFIVRKFIGKGVALLFVIVMSLSSFEIELARECRMYSLFQLTYFLMSFFFYIGLENNGNRLRTFKKIESYYQINIFYLVLSIFLFYFSILIHKLTYTFALVIFIYLMSMFFYRVITEGITKGISSKYFVCLMAMFLFLLCFIILKGDIIKSLIKVASTTDMGDLPGSSNFRYYFRFLSLNYPSLFFIYPLSIIFLIKDIGKKGLFISVSFLPLLLMHMEIFTRQNQRYIFYIFPFFVLGSLYLINLIIKLVVKELDEKTKDMNQAFRIAVILVSVMAFNVFGYPWITQAKNLYRNSRYEHWKGIPEYVVNKVNKGKVITTEYMHYIYYFGRMPDYYMNSNKNLGYANSPSQGIGIIDDINDLKSVFENTDQPLFILFSPWAFNTSLVVEPEMKEYIVNSSDLMFETKEKKKEIFIYQKSSTRKQPR